MKTYEAWARVTRQHANKLTCSHSRTGQLAKMFDKKFAYLVAADDP